MRIGTCVRNKLLPFKNIHLSLYSVLFSKCAGIPGIFHGFSSSFYYSFPYKTMQQLLSIKIYTQNSVLLVRFRLPVADVQQSLVID